MSICVFGSLNMDLVVTAPHLPQPGETLMGSGFEAVPGGKGANQAVAAARMGVPTALVGRVGRDDFGQGICQSLEQAGVQTQGIIHDPDRATGLALITVASGGQCPGENHIVLVPGANGAVGEAEASYLDQALQRSQLLLLQWEIPLEPVYQASQLAQGRGNLVILDPAPVPKDVDRKLDASFYEYVDILTPNEGEAAQLLGRSPSEDWANFDAVEAAQALRHKTRVPMVIVTRGPKGVVCATADHTLVVPAVGVAAVDTTAAGDAFNGALAAALMDQKPLYTALRWGVAAGALATMRPGAQPSLPDRSAVMELLQQSGG